MTTMTSKYEAVLKEISVIQDLLEAASLSAKAADTPESDGAAAVIFVASNQLSSVEGELKEIFADLTKRDAA
ncbi:MAG: hypothetical protein ABSD11_18595 [Methylocella sp.]|jgi:hypothetical protein